MSEHIGFLLGKPVKSGTIIADLLLQLTANQIKISLYYPHDSDVPSPPWLKEAALIVHRGLQREVIEALECEAQGVPQRLWCNPLEASVKVYDRQWLHDRLASSGLPVAKTQVAKTWTDVPSGVESVVIKACDGWYGRSSRVYISHGKRPVKAPFTGPYVVQAYIDHDGMDTKLYIVGDRVFGLYKCTRSSGQGAVAFVPSSELITIARGVGKALGLEIYGVDILEAQDGPVIIDVNPFPGFRGIDSASQELAKYLSARAQQVAA